jgi:two-component system, NarL family, nitrate/nitrite response regulator NarL
MTISDMASDATHLGILTDRERQVATLVCSGLANKAIARALALAEGTVKIHLHAIFRKLNVSSRTALMVKLLPRLARSALTQKFASGPLIGLSLA